MINWLTLLTNSLWLIALSTALAIAGWASWQAAMENIPFRVVIQRRRIRLGLSSCMAVFCLGVATSVQTPWEKIAWAVLTVFALIQWALTLRKDKPEKRR